MRTSVLSWLVLLTFTGSTVAAGRSLEASISPSPSPLTAAPTIAPNHYYTPALFDQAYEDVADGDTLYIGQTGGSNPQSFWHSDTDQCYDYYKVLKNDIQYRAGFCMYDKSVSIDTLQDRYSSMMGGGMMMWVDRSVFSGQQASNECATAQCVGRVMIIEDVGRTHPIEIARVTFTGGYQTSKDTFGGGIWIMRSYRTGMNYDDYVSPTQPSHTTLTPNPQMLTPPRPTHPP